MILDLSTVPFSRYGSYTAFSHVRKWEQRPEGLFLRTVHGDARSREVFQVELLKDGWPVPFKEVAGPTLLRLESEHGSAEICIAEEKLVRIRSTGVGVRLNLNTGQWNLAFPASATRWHVNASWQGVHYMVTALAGQLRMLAPFDPKKNYNPHIVADVLPGAGSSACEMAVEEFRSAWRPREYTQSFDDAAAAAEQDYRKFLKKMPSVPRKYAKAAELAAYIDWSCVVGPEGHFHRPAMLMSKNWMTNVWSWDNCFNAMAMCYALPELAWDQFMVLIDNQDELGAFPDATNDASKHFRYCKPPIHGWTLKRMMERTRFITPARLKEVYEPLCRWTNWWLDYRDYDADGLPQYNHGNDSGWDNATVFDVGYPVEGPDLAAFLVIQTEVLAEVAQKIGRKREAPQWRQRSQQLLQRLMEHCWQDGRFLAKRSGDHLVAQGNDSLLNFLPIILGKRLPKEVRDRLVAGLKEDGRFLTPHGLATESPRSPEYAPDGYWRGPIWAPSTMIIIDGLSSAGEKTLATKIARRFCDTCAAGGFAENFDALTGAPLRDRAYTWTSSVFLILAHEYLK